MQNISYAGMFRPALKREAFIYDLIMVVGASVFIALSAQIAIPVPFSPVPITLQTFAVILTGALLGSRLGSLAVLAYLLEGAVGLPVFAQAHFGFIHLVGSTGGYLLGFIPAAYITGLLAERGKEKSFLQAVMIMTAGTAMIFICGLTWLTLVFNRADVLTLGFYPHLPGAILKIASAAMIYAGGGKFIASKFK
jgi:biotin transport system substrate-specific component